jgi:acetyltransferase-like isoleucine patch superfamily enzyme
MKDILIVIIRLFKKIINRLDLMENEATCNKNVINNGCVFLHEAKVDNMQSNPSKIVIGNGTHIRGELTVFKYGGEIKIGDNCYIGENTIIRSGELITIGNDVLISHCVNIMDTNAHEINHVERAESYIEMLKNGHKSLKGNVKTAPVLIDDNVWISFNVSILKGVHIGRGSIIASDSVVLHDLPPFVLAGGNPAKILKNLDR